MIPFWTNFLVRTYAWMLILRDSGLINNFWTITLHDQAVMLADGNGFFAWIAAITEQKLPLLFNQPAVMLGLFYGYLPFMVLPLYSALEKMDWDIIGSGRDWDINNTRVTRPLAGSGEALQSWTPALSPTTSCARPSGSTSTGSSIRVISAYRGNDVRRT